MYVSKVGCDKAGELRFLRKEHPVDFFFLHGTRGFLWYRMLAGSFCDPSDRISRYAEGTGNAPLAIPVS